MKLFNVRLSNDAESALLSYEWPGNIRELENVIHYALIVCRDGVIQADDLRLIGTSRRRPSAAITLIANQGFSQQKFQDTQNTQDVENLSSRLPSVNATALPVEVSTSSSALPEKLKVLHDVVIELIQSNEPAVFDLVEQTLIESAYNFVEKIRCKQQKHSELAAIF